MKKETQRRILFRTLFLFIVFSFLLGIFFYSNAAANRKLTIHFFDVGQGDAIFIRTPFGQSIIIDGGPDAFFENRVGNILPFYDRTIDLLILTHPHADHVTGLVDIIESFPVKRVVLPDVAHSLPAYHAFLDSVTAKGIPVTLAVRGAQFDFGGDLSLELLAPRKRGRIEKGDLNDSSIVAIVKYNRAEILFMGDAGSDIEKDILTVFPTLHADILKVGHHGSIHSSSEPFITHIDPTAAVISVGTKNRYGHPHARVVQLLEKVAHFLRTDHDGTIVLSTDGYRSRITTEKTRSIYEFAN